MNQGKTQSYYASPRAQAALEATPNKSKYISSLIEQRIDDLRAGLTLLHRAGWQYKDVVAVLALPKFDGGTMFYAAEATVD